MNFILLPAAICFVTGAIMFVKKYNDILKKKRQPIYILNKQRLHLK